MGRAKLPFRIPIDASSRGSIIEHGEDVAIVDASLRTIGTVCVSVKLEPATGGQQQQQPRQSRRAGVEPTSGAGAMPLTHAVLGLVHDDSTASFVANEMLANANLGGGRERPVEAVDQLGNADVGDRRDAQYRYRRQQGRQRQRRLPPHPEVRVCSSAQAARD